MGSKRKALCLEEKIKILNEVDSSSKRKKEIAAEHGIPSNTLSTILKNRKKIEEHFEKLSQCKQMKMRGSKYPDVEKALLMWFQKMRSMTPPVSISDVILKEKAERFAKEMNHDDFECSTGWLSRFKQRNNLTYKVVCGESGGVDYGTTSTWLENTLPELLKGYSQSDIFNADETGLFWRVTPNKTMAFKGESCHGGKQSKERLTLMVCTNMNGSEKTPILAIGKFNKPRCFKNVTRLPVDYVGQKSAWMDGHLFENWLRKEDRKFAMKNRKILLFIDNSPAHPKIEGLQAVKVIYLPPNLTSVLQPCDMGIINNLKHFYRRYLLEKITDDIDNSIVENKINLLDALGFIRRAWESVKPSSIQNCFKKAGFIAPGENSDDDAEILSDLTQEWPTFQNSVDFDISYDEYLKVDENLRVASELSDKDIIESVCGPSSSTANSDNDDDIDDCGKELRIPAYSETQKAIEVLRLYSTLKGNVGLTRKIESVDEEIRTERVNASKQKCITDFFV